MTVYNRLLKTTFMEMTTEYDGVTSVNFSRRVVNVNGLEENDTLGTKSEVIIFYDLLGDASPLLLIERISTDDVPYRVAKKFVKNFRDVKDYRAVIYKVSNSEYDVIVVKDSIVEDR